MATKVEAQAKRLYEEDFYAWTREQTRHLRARRFGAVDLAHLIEEVEELGDARRDAVLGNARIIIEHLLKLEHGPAQDPRNGWRATVREHRARLELQLTPRLRQILHDELSRVFAIARRNADGALRDHGEDAPAAALPDRCPYTLDQLTGDWRP
jgi:Domain of unknown function DUF29